MGKSRSLVLLTVFALAGCASGGPLHHYVNTSDGPEEFGIVPNKNLETPPDNTLPVPTPGSANRADQTPIKDAIATLGGSTAIGAVPASETALVSYASRDGVDADIRSKLKAEDKVFREKAGHSFIGHLFVGDKYVEAYKKLTLNPVEAALKFRAEGVEVPSFPEN